MSWRQWKKNELKTIILNKLWINKYTQNIIEWNMHASYSLYAGESEPSSVKYSTWKEQKDHSLITVNWASTDNVPWMLVALHWYTPESSFTTLVIRRKSAKIWNRPPTAMACTPAPVTVRIQSRYIHISTMIHLMRNMRYHWHHVTVNVLKMNWCLFQIW